MITRKRTWRLTISRGQIVTLILLLPFASLLSFFAMRRILVKVVYFALELRRAIAGRLDRWALERISSEEEGEVSDLARSFITPVDRPEANIVELEQTKQALHRTMFKIGSAVSSVQNFCRSGRSRPWGTQPNSTTSKRSVSRIRF